ncbi:hypothetical protein BO82DRAFT_78408 [Aspergillus uvarum CBS 121591]|uniref:Uncharacterized protein n=1 Tax=Aspergillus uvarum CBS 121591 TaxID=1448315 RepID=A0A319D1B5_9EURO|nr:hypothetical protein BO82DRAFT_78408 [Aspergillus uvarum CBS 121591]PYH81708.1 hypothetical protein BO82DRAFT_78408 [Aspergillus uvarum CBS 121591]
MHSSILCLTHPSIFSLILLILLTNRRNDRLNDSPPNDRDRGSLPLSPPRSNGNYAPHILLHLSSFSAPTVGGDDAFMLIARATRTHVSEDKRGGDPSNGLDEDSFSALDSIFLIVRSLEEEIPPRAVASSSGGERGGGWRKQSRAIRASRFHSIQ